MDVYKESLKLHEKNKGKLEIKSKVSINNKKDLSLAYTPGVAQPCLEIKKNKNNVYKYTIKQNTVAVISDGSAVLGLGNIGAEASIPVMEGKCILMKEFGNIDAFPICITTQDTEEIISIVKNIAPVFGGINLEDISAPRCFEIEERLQNLGIPVFHDDQHGTAIVVLAAVINSLKVVKKNIKDVNVVISGAGAAGITIAKMLKEIDTPVNDVILVDSAGIVSKNRQDLNLEKRKMLTITNKHNKSGSLKDAMKKADIFIGVSAPDIVTEDMVRSMNKKAIVMAMANPRPEILPNKAKKAGAAIICTGRSDFPNQVNNVLAFPGIFRGALDARARKITMEMQLAAAKAIANYIKPTKDKVLPSVLDKKVSKAVADAVRKAAIKQGA